MQNPKSAIVYAKLLSVVVWFALIAQFYLQISSAKASPEELLIRFLSYFTILTNLLVALCCTCVSWFSNSGIGKHFSSRFTQTAIAVYIAVVGLVYNTILRFIWAPTGLQRLVDELLHLFIPVLFVVYWWLFVPKNFGWRDFFAWLIYPLAYLILVLVRGHFSGFYPYPFLDVPQLGYSAVMINCVGITSLFVFFSLLFIGIGKIKKIS
jgi:FlaA1/EpsC-like NDP-sugar epimerase